MPTTDYTATQTSRFADYWAAAQWSHDRSVFGPLDTWTSFTSGPRGYTVRSSRKCAQCRRLPRLHRWTGARVCPCGNPWVNAAPTPGDNGRRRSRSGLPFHNSRAETEARLARSSSYARKVARRQATAREHIRRARRQA